MATVWMDSMSFFASLPPELHSIIARADELDNEDIANTRQTGSHLHAIYTPEWCKRLEVFVDLNERSLQSVDRLNEQQLYYNGEARAVLHLIPTLVIDGWRLDGGQHDDSKIAVFAHLAAISRASVVVFKGCTPRRLGQVRRLCSVHGMKSKTVRLSTSSEYLDDMKLTCEANNFAAGLSLDSSVFGRCPYASDAWFLEYVSTLCQYTMEWARIPALSPAHMTGVAARCFRNAPKKLTMSFHGRLTACLRSHDFSARLRVLDLDVGSNARLGLTIPTLKVLTLRGHGAINGQFLFLEQIHVERVTVKSLYAPRLETYHIGMGVLGCADRPCEKRGTLESGVASVQHMENSNAAVIVNCLALQDLGNSHKDPLACPDRILSALLLATDQANKPIIRFDFPRCVYVRTKALQSPFTRRSLIRLGRVVDTTFTLGASVRRTRRLCNSLS